MLRVYFLLAILTIFNANMEAQTLADIGFAATLPTRQTGHQINYANHEGVSKFVTKTYLFYKNMISSQDVFRCSFYPTCANYTISSMSEFGFLTGLIIGLDRVTRCNHAQSDWYDWHFPSESMFDPVPVSNPNSP